MRLYEDLSLVLSTETFHPFVLLDEYQNYHHNMNLRPIIVTVCSLSLAVNCWSQLEFRRKYIDLLSPGATLIASGYNFTVEEVSADECIYKRYYPDNRQITHLITFKSRNLVEKNGSYEERYDDGTLLHKGTYVENLKEGKWIENVVEHGEYRNGMRIGSWIKFDREGRRILESSYVNGNLHGTVIHYDTIGQIEYEEVYSDGQQISASRDSIVIETLPLFPGCEELDEGDQKDCADNKLLQFIYGKIRYPNSARNKGVEGEALIKFVIEKDGTIGSIEPLRKVTKDIGKECVRVVEQMPEWKPGTQNGKPVRVQFYLPVRFNLE